MRTIEILVKANHNVETDTKVSVRIDTTFMWRNEVTLRFDNEDYCDVSVTHFYESCRYLTTYVNVYAVEEFIQQLKDGKITIEKVDCENCIVKQWLPCSKGIPCCQCKDRCNGRQPCPKKGG